MGRKKSRIIFNPNLKERERNRGGGGGGVLQRKKETEYII